MERFVLALIAFVALAVPVLGQAFPVTVAHNLGEATIPAPPMRVVSLGLNDHDFLYALGVAPVGVHEWWGGRPYATWPWAEDERLALSAEPAVLESNEINVEWVAALTPDLIVAAYSDIDQATYDLLTQIAPVVTGPKGFSTWGAPWQEQLRIIDLATSGTTEKAEAIIADLEAQTAAVRDKYPELAGRTGSMADFREGQFTLWSSAAQPTRFLMSFGMVFPAELDALADDTNWIYVSPEKIELIDLDAVVWPNGKRAEIEALSVYGTTGLAKEGRSVWLDDGSGVLPAALWFQSPLSLGYAIEHIGPLLAAAVDGDPATK